MLQYNDDGVQRALLVQPQSQLLMLTGKCPTCIKPEFTQTIGLAFSIALNPHIHRYMIEEFGEDGFEKNSI